MNNTNSNFTLTIKTIKINYPSIFEHIADDNNTINNFIRTIAPDFTGYAYLNDEMVAKLLNMKCFTITKAGLLVFTGAVGLLKADNSDDCQVVVAESVKKLQNISKTTRYIKNGISYSLYGVTAAHIIINKELSLAKNIVYDYIGWLKKQEKEQAKALSEAEINELVDNGKSLFNQKDLGTQILKNVEHQVMDRYDL